MARKPQTEAGFTLLELLVALSTTMIALAGLMSMLTTSIQSSGHVTASQRAIELTDARLEETMALSWARLEDRYGQFPIAVEFNLLDDGNGRIYSQRMSVTEHPADTDLLRYRVETIWEGPGLQPDWNNMTLRTREVVLESLRNKYDNL